MAAQKGEYGKAEAACHEGFSAADAVRDKAAQNAARHHPDEIDGLRGRECGHIYAETPHDRGCGKAQHIVVELIEKIREHHAHQGKQLIAVRRDAIEIIVGNLFRHKTPPV